jgi:16S rRNA (uracil1498-N3)-methyltransferase
MYICANKVPNIIKLVQMNLFYAPDLNFQTKYYIFDKDESRHISKVLRKKVGEKLFLTNGKGLFFEAEITDDNPKKTQISILTVEKKEKRNYKLHIAIAPTKSNERFEWFLEKATELGIDEITPLVTTRSERKKIKTERYQKILIAAMKQSLQTYLPLLHPLTTWDDFIQKDLSEPVKLMAYCQSDKPITDYVEKDKDVLVLIGPEGGFSDVELANATKKGFIPVMLSENRLRTETAGLISVMAIHLSRF